MSLVIGVDVSSYQNSTFTTAGLSFAIVKATEYTDYVNPEYTAQVAHARAAGLVVGHYHFARSVDSAAEVAYFAAHASVQPGDIIALDWEVSSVTPAARDAWLKDCKARYPHNRVILYCDVDYWDTLDTEHYAADGLWIADYSHSAGHPNIDQAWKFDQYSSSGGIDHSVGNFASKADLITWCHGLEPVVVAPTPKPVIPVSTLPIKPVEDEDMSATSVNGVAGLAWTTGAKHSIGVIYDDNAANTAPVLRVVMALHTGPFVVDGAWKPAKGCDSLELPAEHVADCQGVILEDAGHSVFYVTAG